jgi:hypothetical protein
MPHFLRDAGISSPSVIEHARACDYHGTRVRSYLKRQRLWRCAAREKPVGGDGVVETMRAGFGGTRWGAGGVRAGALLLW